MQFRAKDIGGEDAVTVDFNVTFAIQDLQFLALGFGCRNCSDLGLRPATQ